MKKPRISPYVGILIEREVAGTLALTTAYTGSSLKGGHALAQALLSAQADPAARRVLYMEFVHAQVVVSVSVSIQHEDMARPLAEDLF